MIVAQLRRRGGAVAAPVAGRTPFARRARSCARRPCGAAWRPGGPAHIL